MNRASALLYIVRASLEDDLEWMQKHAEPSDILFKKEDMVGPTRSYEPNSALNVLMNKKNKELKIFINDVDEWDDREKNSPQAKTTYTRFKHLVEKQYGLLEQIMDQQSYIEEGSGVNLKLRARKYLEG